VVAGLKVVAIALTKKPTKMVQGQRKGARPCKDGGKKN